MESEINCSKTEYVAVEGNDDELCFLSGCEKDERFT